MTRTEQQLREALTDLADLAERPSPVPVRRHRPARVRATVLAVAAVLVLVVGASVVAVVRAGEPRPSATVGAAPTSATTSPRAWPSSSESPAPSGELAPFSPLRAVFSLDPAAGFVLAGRHNTVSVQSGYVLLPDRPKAEIDVSVYATGVFDATSAATGTRVTVQGQDGWRGPVDDPETGRTLTSVVWQYASGGWAVVTDRSGLTTGGATAAEELAVADAVRVTGTPSPVPVPFRLGWLPPEVQVETVQTTTSGGGPSASIGFSDDRPGYTPTLPGNGGAITVRYRADLITPTRSPDVEVDGHDGWFTDAPAVGVDGPGRVLQVRYDSGFLLFAVDPLHTDRYADPTLVRIAATAEPVTPLTDPAAWIPAADAVAQ